MHVLWGVFLSHVFLLFIWCWWLQSTSRSTTLKHFAALISALQRCHTPAEVCVCAVQTLSLKTLQKSHLTSVSHTHKHTPHYSLTAWMNCSIISQFYIQHSFYSVPRHVSWKLCFYATKLQMWLCFCKECNQTVDSVLMQLFFKLIKDYTC